MASWHEIDRFRKSPTAFRALAGQLLKLGDELTDWEKTFLDSISNKHRDEITARQAERLLQISHTQEARRSKKQKEPSEEDYTTRQSEKLLEIRDDYEVLTEIRGFSVKIILCGSWEGRLDLPESAEERIVKMYEKSPTSIRRKDARFLMWCARQLNLVEEEFTD